jgi:hypothetical protein
MGVGKPNQDQFAFRQHATPCLQLNLAARDGAPALISLMPPKGHLTGELRSKRGFTLMIVLL